MSKKLIVWFQRSTHYRVNELFFNLFFFYNFKIFEILKNGITYFHHRDMISDMKMNQTVYNTVKPRDLV